MSHKGFPSCLRYITPLFSLPRRMNPLRLSWLRIPLSLLLMNPFVFKFFSVGTDFSKRKQKEQSPPSKKTANMKLRGILPARCFISYRDAGKAYVPLCSLSNSTLGPSKVFPNETGRCRRSTFLNAIRDFSGVSVFSLEFFSHPIRLGTPPGSFQVPALVVAYLFQKYKCPLSRRGLSSWGNVSAGSSILLLLFRERDPSLTRWLDGRLSRNAYSVPPI